MLVLYGIIVSNGCQNIVELGTLHSVTTKFLAKAARLVNGHVWTVDRDSVPQIVTGVTYLTGDTDAVTFDRPIDFLFMDADHTREGTLRDWKRWSPKVVPNGFVAIHDTADEAIQDFLRWTFPDPTETWQFIDLPGDHGLGIARRLR